MSRKRFTKEQIEILSKNENVNKVSDKPYDPCDLLDPRNSFLFEDDGINESHKGLNPETRTALGPDEDKDDPFHED